MTRRTSRTVRLLASSTLGLVLVAGCSGGGGGKAPRAQGFPDPAAGKVAAFDIGALSTTYDLDETVRYQWTLVASDRAGNVYVMDINGNNPDVLRLTSQGKVSRYTRAYPPGAPAVMVVLADGSLAFGDAEASDGTIYEVGRDGIEKHVQVPGATKPPLPIGERPDGSLVVSEGGNIVAVKGGRATTLYHQAEDVGTSAVLDGSGTVYVVPEHLGDVVAIPVGKQPSHLHVSDSSTGAAAATALSALAPSQMAPDASGGFYALADNAADTEQFVVHVRGSTATVLAKLTTASHGCRTGKQYPALANSCTTQSYLARSGSRVLLLADRSAQPEDDPQPALALKAAAS